MSRTIEHLYTLYNNPFYLAPIIVKFYEHYKGRHDKDVLLAYLILPLVLNEDSRRPLLKKDSRRTIRTYFNFHKKLDEVKGVEEVKKNKKLFGLSDRVEEFKQMTNLCLQYAIDRGCLSITDDLCISFNRFDFEHDNTLVEYLAAAENLAVMFRNDKITHIYMMFGIKNL